MHVDSRFKVCNHINSDFGRVTFETVFAWFIYMNMYFETATQNNSSIATMVWFAFVLIKFGKLKF